MAGSLRVRSELPTMHFFTRTRCNILVLIGKTCQAANYHTVGFVNTSFQTKIILIEGSKIWKQHFPILHGTFPKEPWSACLLAVNKI